VSGYAVRQQPPDLPAVCILAMTRRGPYWVDVAPSLSALAGLASQYTRRDLLPGEEVSLRDVVLVAWYEAYASRAEAEFRADEVRQYSPLGLRSLIEYSNPQWLDMGAEAVGFPWPTTLPERLGMPHRPVTEL
jgi:hypothetical protein